MSPDIAASIRARLLNKAKAGGEEFQLFLTRYTCERFLYRLGASPLRGTVWPSEPPEVLTASFYSTPNLQTRWSAYLRSGAFRVSPPATFDVIGTRIRAFLGPIRECIVADTHLNLHWSVSGHWRSPDTDGDGGGVRS